MTPEQIKLAQALVKLPWWRWVPGMLTVDDGRVVSPPYMDFGIWHVLVLCNPGAEDEVVYPWRADDLTPDLTDPATFGCLLVLARERYPRGITMDVHPQGIDVSVCGPPLRSYSSEDDHPGTALAKAILAAEGA